MDSYSRASAAHLRISSSLYLVAALLVYFALWSLLASAAEPPCDWKYLVALSFPPTLKIRNWSHCQTRSRQYTLFCVNRWHAYCRGWWIARTRCGRPCYGGSTSSRDTGIYQREQNSMLDSLRRNRNISTVGTLALPRPDSLSKRQRTLFADFAFSLVKICCDCVLVASAMAKTVKNGCLVGGKGVEPWWDSLAALGNARVSVWQAQVRT